MNDMVRTIRFSDDTVKTINIPSDDDLVNKIIFAPVKGYIHLCVFKDDHWCISSNGGATLKVLLKGIADKQDDIKMIDAHQKISDELNSKFQARALLETMMGL